MSLSSNVPPPPPPDAPALHTAHAVFTTSPHMLGLCLTGVGLVKIYTRINGITTLTDDLLALSCAAFLVSNVLSYFSIRAKALDTRIRTGRWADLIFLAALCLTAIVSLLIVLQLEG